jgi:uncharacterized protein YciI
MKYYLLEGEFTDNHPTGDDLNKVLAEHGAYLTNDANKVNVLLAGPKIDRSGGIIIIKSDDIQDFCYNDPLIKHGVQTYRISEFSINEYSDLLTQWRE